jgi:hypothetical protein
METNVSVKLNVTLTGSVGVRFLSGGAVPTSRDLPPAIKMSRLRRDLLDATSKSLKDVMRMNPRRAEPNEPRPGNWTERPKEF